MREELLAAPKWCVILMLRWESRGETRTRAESEWRIGERHPVLAPGLSLLSSVAVTAQLCGVVLLDVGFIEDRLHSVVFTPRDGKPRVISLRKKNKREVNRGERQLS